MGRDMGLVMRELPAIIVSMLRAAPTPVSRDILLARMRTLGIGAETGTKTLMNLTAAKTIDVGPPAHYWLPERRVEYGSSSEKEEPFVPSAEQKALAQRIKEAKPGLAVPKETAPDVEMGTVTCSTCGHVLTFRVVPGVGPERVLALHTTRVHSGPSPKPEAPPTPPEPEPDHPPAARKLMGLDKKDRQLRFPYVVECAICGFRRGKLRRGQNWTTLRIGRIPRTPSCHSYEDVSYLYRGGKPPSSDRTRPEGEDRGGAARQPKDHRALRRGVPYTPQTFMPEEAGVEGPEWGTGDDPKRRPPRATIEAVAGGTDGSA